VDDISITGTLTGVWTGTISTNWATVGNWSDNTVPAATTNVTIPASAPYWPSYAAGPFTLGTQCKNITMKGASQLTITGHLTIPAGRELNVTGTGLLKVKGNFVKNGTFSAGDGTVEFYGNLNGALSGTSSPVFNKVTISKTSPYYIDFNVNTTINKTLNVTTGSIYKVKTGKTLTISGTASR
jgi:hypothetical protein